MSLIMEEYDNVLTKKYINWAVKILMEEMIMNKKTKTLVIIVTLLSLHSCTLFYNAMAVGLAGVAGAAALEDKKSGKTKTYKGTKRVCTAYSDSYGGVRQCLNWSNEPVYE